MKALIEQVQTLVGVNADGSFGPITTKAVASKLNCDANLKSIQKTLDVLDDGVLGPITLNAIISKLSVKETVSVNAEKVISIAKTQIGIHETSANHGEGIAKYWTACDYSEGYNDRAPYCAACMSWCIKEAGFLSDKERPKTAAAFGYEGWASENSKKATLIKKPKKVVRGQLVIFAFSHIGIATSDSDVNGYFNTVEANTGANGSRDGDGVYAKTRNINTVRSVVAIL